MTELRLDPRNARRHSDRNKRQIKQSLETVGAGRSILADADGIVRAGNGVFAEWGDKPVKIVETDGTELVVVQRTDLRGQDAIRAAALDNLVADSSAFDYDAAILAEIARDDDVIRAIANEDAKLLTLLAGDRVVNDPLAEWRGMPEYGNTPKAFKSIHIHFESAEAVKNFAELIEQEIGEHTSYLWYPAKERQDLKSLAYVSES